MKQNSIRQSYYIESVDVYRVLTESVLVYSVIKCWHGTIIALV